MKRLKVLTNTSVSRFIHLLVLLTSLLTANAQVNLGPDTTICAGTTLNLSINGPGVQGTTVNLTDDLHSALIPIGFPFTFFGNTYNSLVIGSNDYVTFNANAAGTTSPWNITAGIPDPTLPTNSIMAPYQDIDPGDGGTVNYTTLGIAPNRIFVITFYEVPMFSCSDLCFGNQIKLFEGSNDIEIHIGNKPLCPTWNSGVAIEGIQNANGTVAYVVPGRNYPTQWTANNDAYRFTPTGPTTYNMTSIPFNFENVITGGGGITISWYRNGVYFGTGTNINVTPTQTTTYTGTVSLQCSGQMFSDDLVVTVVQPQVSVSPTTASVCGSQTVDLTASGAQNYSWSPSTGLSQTTGATVIATPSATTTYTVTGTDANGCTASANSTITVAPSYSASITNQTDVTCPGNNDGSISVMVDGGNSGYTFQWSDGQNTTNATNLSVGTYTVTISDNSGCQLVLDTVINELPAITISSSSFGSGTISCSGGTNGSISVTPNNGTTPYTYAWSNGAYGETINNLTVGTYTVTVTDANGCTATESYTLAEPSDIASSITSPTFYGGYNISCADGNDGSIDLTVTGGTTPYGFSWNNGASTEDINNLSAGLYVVTITDANGCTITNTLTLDEPTPITTEITNSDYNGNNISCNGTTDGTVELEVTGGTQPYTYLWSNGGANQDITGLGPGAYTVTVTDANGCVTTQSTSLTEPEILSVNIDSPTYPSGDEISCNGLSDGSIDVIVMGGASPYTYSWSNGSITQNLNGLPAGPYTLSVTDANGCTQSESTTLSEPTVLTTTITNIIDASCSGNNDGSATISVNGGAGSYVYLWSDGQSNSTAINLSSGSYTVIVNDENGCVEQDTAIVSQPTTLASSISSSTNVSCNGGSDGTATVLANGGSGVYTYLWSNGQTTDSIGNLYAGNLTVTVTDDQSCTSTTSLELTEPEELTLGAFYSQAICIGESITIDANLSGGTPPYTYQWTASPNDVSLISDNANPTVSPIINTDYTLTAIDANGCTQTFSPIKVEVLEPLDIELTFNGSSGVCPGFNTDIIFNATGGDDNYTYTWLSGGNGILTPNQVTVTPLITTTYQIVVTDGCTTPADTGSIEVTVYDLPVVGFNADITEGCVPLNIDFTNTTTNGETYYWEFTQNSSQTVGNSSNTDPVYLFEHPGSYDITLVATSAEGCVDSLTQTDLITVRPLPHAAFDYDPKTINLLQAWINFDDLSTGAVAWNWSFGDGDTTGEKNPTHLYTDTGHYTVQLTVTNQYGCLDSVEWIVNITPDGFIYVPSAFTPNGDGLNDTFFPVTFGLENPIYSFRVFNRWGEQLFESQTQGEGWDGTFEGKKVPEGVYVYNIFASDKNLETTKLIGKVHVIR